MIPIRLEMTNFQSYDHAVLDFNFDSALIIGERDNNPDISNGCGKCLPGDTILTHAITGERITIGELERSGRKDFWVPGLDRNGRQVPAKVVACVKTGRKQLILIKMKNGVEQAVSLSHPILVGLNKTIEASRLKVGDQVGQPRAIFKINTGIHSGISDINWGRVEKIKLLRGLHQTYDIQIDLDTHLYALDAFYTHNSSIFESIGWSIFGKSKQKNADSVVKRSCDYCEVDFTFEHDSKKYRILRKRNSRFSRVEVNFFEVQSDGQEIMMQGDTNREIDARIREILKTNYDVFLNSCYFRQNTISDFMNGTASTKQKIVSSILNLDRWNVYMDAAKDKMVKSNRIADNIRFKLKGTEDLEERLERTKKELEENKDKAKHLDVKEMVLGEEIGKLESRVNNLKLKETSLNDYHDTVSRLDNVKDRILELEITVEKKKKEANHLSNSVAASRKTISELEDKIEEISSHLELKNKFELPALEQNFLQGKTKLSVVTEDIDRWNGDAVCQCCSRPWKEHADKVLEIQKKREEHQNITSKLNKLSQKIGTAKKIAEKIKNTEVEIEKYTGRTKSLANNIEIHELKLEAARKELEAAELMLQEKYEDRNLLESRIKGMDEIVENNKYEEMRSLLKEKKREKQQVIESKNAIIYQVGGLTQKVDELSRGKLEKDELNNKLDETVKSIAIHTSLVKSFGRTGIQAIIIDNVIEELTKVANEWLNQFCYEPTYIKFVTQKQDSKGGWKETLEIQVVTPSGVCDFESLSGGEAFRVAFAIRLGLAQIQARRMGGETQLLLLDEVNTSLDRHGLEMFVSIIRKLEKKMKVMVVTHDDKLKEEFDYIVSVKKQGRNSTLTVR